MVLSFGFTHVFKQSVESVLESYKQWVVNVGVKAGDDLFDGEMTCVRCHITRPNYFPPLLQKINSLKYDRIQIFEEIWSYPKARMFWVRSQTSTWDDGLVASVVHAAPDASNSKWTQWNETYVVDFDKFGVFGRVLELYLKLKLGQVYNEKIEALHSLNNKLI